MKIVKIERMYAEATTRRAKSLWDIPEGKLHLWITFFPPDKRRYDDDNIFARFKAARDGIADGLGVDDSRFVSHPLLSDKIKKGGQVHVRITGNRKDGKGD